MKTLFYLSLTLAACRLSAQSIPAVPIVAQPIPAAPASQPVALVTQRPASQPAATLIRHLPPDACTIYHFNLPVLRTKLALQQLTERIPLPQKNTYNRELAAILREPGRAGVDTTRDIFLTETNGQGRDSLSTTSLLVHLSDSARWSAFLRELAPGLRTTSIAGQERMGSAWDNNLAILTFVRGIAHTISPAGTTNRAIRQSQTLLQGFDDSTSIHDPLFLTGFSDDADIHAWTDQGKLLFLLLQQLFHFDHTPTYPALTAPGCGKVHTLSALRFEKGRLLLTNTLCLPPGIDSLYARLSAHPLPANLLAQIPSGTLLGLINLHFDPTAVPALLEGLQARGRSEALLFDKGVSLESFARAFQGDFLFTAVQPPTPIDTTNLTAPANPITSANPTSPKTTIPPRPALYLATNLLDPSAFWSWANHLKWLNPSTDPSGAGRVSTRNPLSKKLPAYKIKDSLLVIGSSPKRVAVWFDDSVASIPSDTLIISSTTYQGATSRAYPPRVSDASTLRRFRDCPISGWLDLKALTTSMRQRPPAERNPALLSILSTLDLLTFTAGQLNAMGQLENTTELTFANSEENSLRILFKLLQ